MNTEIRELTHKIARETGVIIRIDRQVAVIERQARRFGETSHKWRLQLNKGNHSVTSRDKTMHIYGHIEYYTRTDIQKKGFRALAGIATGKEFDLKTTHKTVNEASIWCGETYRNSGAFVASGLLRLISLTS